MRASSISRYAFTYAARNEESSSTALGLSTVCTMRLKLAVIRLLPQLFFVRHRKNWAELSCFESGCLQGQGAGGAKASPLQCRTKEQRRQRIRLAFGQDWC